MRRLILNSDCFLRTIIMAYFGDQLKDACKDFIQKNVKEIDLCSKIQTIANCTRESTENKKFLTGLKEVLQSKSLPDVDLLLKFLVPLYLSISNKNAAKKVLSSYFQGLASPLKETAQELLCQKVQESCQAVSVKDFTYQTNTRHVVDMVAALMDNFALGEACVTAVSSTVVMFLARAQDYFFQLFRQGGQSAVQTNMVMHDCHVTMQALNRLTQRHLPRDPQHLQHLNQSAFALIMQKDIDIMLDEQMMVDCRCCCAINLVLLLQIAAPDVVPQVMRNWLELEAKAVSAPSWLEPVNLCQLTLSDLSPMTSLALLWGMLSMLESGTLVMAARNGSNISTERDGSVTDCLAVADGRSQMTGISDTVSSNTTTGSQDSASFITVTSDIGCASVKVDSVKRDLATSEVGDAVKDSVGLTPKSGQHILVFELLLEKLLSVDESCQSTVSRVQCIKTVTLWTTRMMSCLKEPALPQGVSDRLRGEESTLQHLLTYVWTHWQDQLDAIRQNSRIIFNNCLKLHVLASRHEDTSTDSFLLSLLDQVLDMDWGNLSKFTALTCLVQWVGTSPVLRRYPNFPSTLLAQVAEQAMACHVSELYEVLIGHEKCSGKVTEGGHEDETRDWLSVWVNPIIAQLCSSNRKLKQHIIEYVLPKVMKKDKVVLEYMLKTLSSSEETGVEPLGALIVCLRRGRAWGLMSEALHTQDNTAPVWIKIYSALSSPEEQVRLDAFALLCESKRTAEAISKVEFDHVRHFITYNLNNQSPAFRQAMLAFTKKLFYRINESQQALLRQMKKKQKESECTAVLQAYKSFLSWLESFLFNQLYPSAAFARRTMSLAILSLLVDDVQSAKDSQGYRPLSNVTANHMHTLLECLTDTFDENKKEAFKLLVFCTAHHTNLLTEEKCRALYTAAMQLAVSTRPQDCGTAAYIFRLLLQQPCIISIIQASVHLPQHISLSSQDQTSSRAGAESASKEGLQEASGTSIAEGTTKQDEMSDLEKMMKKLRAGDGDETSAILQLLQALLLLLMEQVTVAQTSLILAAANRPIYPTLHCIRSILNSVDFRSLDEKEKPVWNVFVNCLLQVCLQIARVVSPVVQNSSPEGNVPEEAVLGPGLKFDLGLMAEVEESRQTVSLMPEYLVVCCWRSIKEVSLLLGQLCLNVPVTQPAVCEGLLSFLQIEEIGRYFKQQLMESLHRGAFELAYAGFVMMCQMLWKSHWNELQMLPRRWLEEVTSAITSTKESSALCATRRSAGVPFFIQAIVATETTSSGRPSFHQAMAQLLNIALSSAASSGSASTDGQVHALNILRALYKDTRLGEDVAPYICDGLKAAILGFKSEFWEVRNSATLLLSALMTRIFGVKRSKDESVLSKRNSQTGRSFFHKYPALYQFLLTELELATENLGSSGHLHLHPSLYPVLMVLGRLFPSTMEGNTTRLNLAAFIPYVIKCSSSPVYKTRMMAARALQPLVGKEQLISVLTSLLTALSQHRLTADCRPSHSHIHGLLLQVYHLVLLMADVSGAVLQTLGSVCVAGWLPSLWLITRENPCLCTRTVALDVTDLILSNTAPILSLLPSSEQQNLSTIRNQLTDTLMTEVWSPPSSLYSSHTPFLSEFFSCVARLAMNHLCVHGGRDDGGKKMVLKLLDFPVYEVHVTVVESMLVCCTAGEEDPAAPKSQSGLRPRDHADRETETESTAGAGDEGRGGDRTWSRLPVSEEAFSRLLHMGLEDGAHPETVIKIFQLLSMSPGTSSSSQEWMCIGVFEKVLLKLQTERRADVKASLIQFSGKFVSFLCRELNMKKDDCGGKTLCCVEEWSQVLMTSCDTEQPDDLHLSCAQVLQDNCQHLLVDKDQCLGSLVFKFWSLLVTLLQADDLEVKDVASSVSARLCGSGGSHPEQAVGQLINTMLSLHGGSQPLGCISTAFSWITPQTADADEGTERLFDKGELNTFQDRVALAHVVTQTLAQFFCSLKDQTSEGGVLEDISPAPKHTQQHGNPQSPHTAFSGHGPQSAGDCYHAELAEILQKMADLMKAESMLPADETNSLESVFLRGSAYSDHTVLLIKLALIANTVDSLKDCLPVPGRLSTLCRKVAEYCSAEMKKHPACNFLLQTVVENL